MTSEFIGSGWGFPVRVDATGGIRLVSRETEIEESIRLILSTAYGERPMRPDFGCGIHDHVFDPADGRTASRMELAVRESLRRWEPRVDVLDVKVGTGAFMAEMKDARALARSLVDTARGAGCPTRALITDMNQPLALTAGNALEVAEVMDTLTGRAITQPLWDLTVALGGELLALCGAEADAAKGGAASGVLKLAGKFRARAPRW